MNTREEIKESVERIKRELGGRAELLAAVKTVPPEYINYAIDCGVTLIGENRVSEVLEKYGRIDRTRAKLHFIGALQTNKVKYIIDKVDMIQSVDRESLASEIEKQAAKHGIIMPVLVEINIGGEESKSGIRPECALEFCKYLADLPHIRVSGLMAVPPKSGDQCIYGDTVARDERRLPDGGRKRFDNGSDRQRDIRRPPEGEYGSRKIKHINFQEEQKWDL